MPAYPKLNPDDPFGHDLTISDKPDFGSSWREREELAERFGEVDFGCDFKDGKCCSTRKGNHPENACCGGCFEAGGYLHEVNPAHVKTYQKLFKRGIGFWRPGTGCSLPRALRSSTCIGFRCFDAVENASPRATLLPWLKELADSFPKRYHFRALAYGHHQPYTTKVG
jgi:hypothetical protein